MGAIQKEAVRPEETSVRHLDTLAEFEACVALERIVWGEQITVPSPVFVVAKHTGGQVLGAFQAGRMVGFTMALAGVHDGKPFLHSHMTAVLPELQNRGVGRLLKLAQREDALARGIGLVEWTFDPLELRNAHFNLVRLGAIARRYIANCYGITDSPLHAGLPTDRLVAEWRLASPRVQDVLAGKTPDLGEFTVRIAVPSDIGDWKHREGPRALHAQGEIREQFEHWFSQGYVATRLERAGPVAQYVLEPPTSRANWE